MRVTNKELGAELGRHETSVSRLRSSDEMPRLDGNSLNSLCVALTLISRKRGMADVIGPADLFDFDPDIDLVAGSMPSYHSSDSSGKSASKGKDTGASSLTPLIWSTEKNAA